jgi:hypothetical protein
MSQRYFARLTDEELAELIAENRRFTKEGNPAGPWRLCEAATEAARRLVLRHDAEEDAASGRRQLVARRAYSVLWWVLLLAWPLAAIVTAETINPSQYGRPQPRGIQLVSVWTWLALVGLPLLIAVRWAVEGEWRFRPGGWTPPPA